jgi:hypothetical protein
MRKITLTLLTITALISCSKEEETTPINQNCNCGIIANDGINNNGNWIEVRNNCSSNKTTVYLDSDRWMNAHIGNSYCPNIGNW